MVQAAIITLRTKEMCMFCCMVGMHQERERERERERRKQKHCRVRSADEPICLLCSQCSCVSACTEPACLCRAAQMGVLGDGCCQLTDQAVGRWSHCYSPHKHVGHVRHAPWRHTRGGYCVWVFDTPLL